MIIEGEIFKSYTIDVTKETNCSNDESEVFKIGEANVFIFVAKIVMNNSFS